MQEIGRVSLLFLLLALAINQAYSSGGLPITNLQIGNSWPRSLAIDPKHHVVYMVTVSGIYPPSGFALTLLDAIKNTIIKTIPLNGFPGKLLFNEENDELYVTNGTSISIFKNGALVNHIKFDEYISSITLNQKLNEIYATSLSTLFVIDGYSLHVIQSIKIGNYIQSMVIDKEGELGYIIRSSPSELIGIDLQERRINSRLSLNNYTVYPDSLVFDNESGEIYVSTGRNSLLIIDPKNNFVRPLLFEGIQLHTKQLAIDQIRHKIFVSTDEPNILIIDAKSLTIIDTINLQYEPYELAIEQQSGTLYFTSYHQLTEIKYAQKDTSNLYILALPIIIATGILLTILLYRRNKMGVLI